MFRHADAVTALLLFLAGTAPTRADFVQITQPNAAYLAATTLLPITATDLDTVNSLTDGFQTATFPDAMALTVSTTWTTWSTPPDSETATPRVLWTTTGIAFTEISLAVPSRVFGLELQPNNTGVVADIFADFYDGGTGGTLVGTIGISVDGDGGARLFAASTTTNFFDTVTLAIDFLADDSFGMAQFRYAVPEPSAIVLLGTGLMGLAFCRRQRTRFR